MCDTLIAVFIGGLITYFVSKNYYIKSGQQLTKEIEEIRRTRKRQLLLDIYINLGYISYFEFDQETINILLEGDIYPRVAELLDICPSDSVSDIVQAIENLKFENNQNENISGVWQLSKNTALIASQLRDRL